MNANIKRESAVYNAGTGPSVRIIKEARGGAA